MRRIEVRVVPLDVAPAFLLETLLVTIVRAALAVERVVANVIPRATVRVFAFGAANSAEIIGVGKGGGIVADRLFLDPVQNLLPVVPILFVVGLRWVLGHVDLPNGCEQSP